MNRRPVALAIAAAVLVALPGCTGPAPTSASSETVVAAGTPSAGADPTAWVESTLSSMTIEEKVGQLFVPRVYGTTASTTDPEAVGRNREELGVDNALGLISAYHVGGIVYFGENVTTPAALAEFGNALQEEVGRQRVQVPVLTSIDQEQGNVVRVGPPATQFPGSMALGAGRSQADAAAAARITGAELRAMGVFQNYAPVADVNANPANPVIGARSFSSRPSLVASLVAAQVAGYQEAGVAATAKHFPGHGDTSVDSHSGLPVITHSRAQLRRLDLRPFRAAIAAGVDVIMTAHIVVPAIDPSGDPATLSRPVVTGLLRDTLGFDGVIVTDSLRMEGVRTKYGDEVVPVLGILAGVDQLLDPPNLPVAYRAVLDAVSSGRISIPRLDRSVRRILALKAGLGLVSPGTARVDVDAVASGVGRSDSAAQAVAITDRTTTVVRDVAGIIPRPDLAGARVLVTGWGESATASLAQSLRTRSADVSVAETGVAPGAAGIQAAVSAARGMDLVVVVTYDVVVHREQAALVQALTAAGAAVVVVAVGTPYDIAYFPEVPAFVAAYSYQPVALDSFVRVLAGDVAATGRLPVEIPAAGDAGQVLYPFGWPSGASVPSRG